MSDARLLPRTIRGEFALFALGLALPLVGLIGYGLFDRARDERAAAEDLVVRIAESSVNRVDEYIAGLRATLEAVARRPLVRAMDAARCDPRLADLVDLYPRAGSFIAVDREGTIVCSSRPLPRGTAVRIVDEELLREMLADPVFRISKPVRSRISGRWIVSAVQPVLGEGGKLLGTVAIATDLLGWRPFPSPEGLPEGAIVTIVTSDGTIIAQSVDAEKWVSRKLWDQRLINRIAVQGRQAVHAAGADGVSRVFGIKQTAGLPWFVLVGLPEESVLGPARERLAETGAVLALVMALVAAFTWAMVQRLSRPMRAIAAAVNARAEGRKDERLPEGGPLELARVASELNRMIDAGERAAAELNKQAGRLRIIHVIDRAIIAEAQPEAIAAAVLQPLRELLGVARVNVNMIDHAAGVVEWLAAAGRHRTRVVPGVRFPLHMLGDVEALRRGEPQTVDTQALPPGPDADALLAAGIRFYMAVPMIAGGELIGALSFGGEQRTFPEEQVLIAQEVATQLAIAIAQARLFERVRRHAEELERRVAERTAQLDSLNHDLKDLYDNVPCGYHSVDENGLFVRMNQTELNWLGYSRDEIIGKMGPADLHTPASLEIFKQRFKAFRQTGVAKDVEYEFRRKDGSVLPVVLNATAVRDRDGKFLMSRSTIFDNTERKRAAQALRESEQEMRMLHAATLGISEAEGSDAALAVLLRTVCEYFGWSFAQSWLPDEGRNRLVLGAAWYSGVGALQSFRKANERLAFAPKDGALERVWRGCRPAWEWDLQPAPSAVRRPLMIEAGLKSWIAVPVAAEGKVIAVVEFFDHELRERDEGVLRLISILASQLGPAIQRKRASEEIDSLNASLKRHSAQLEAANEELEAFSYSVSHDLRAPLRAVDGYALMLQEDHADRLDEEGRRLLGVVRAEASRMGLLIDDLLRFSQVGRKPLAVAPVDMRSLAGETLAELTQAFPKARVELGALPAAAGDRALLRQVWSNLIGNALKYSARRETPRVEIGGRIEGPELVYSVRDNGAGFDMRYGEKLFKVFQRLHREDEFEGTGVGLAIVKRVVERHGGRAWADARPDQGATFHFSLPGAS